MIGTGKEFRLGLSIGFILALTRISLFQLELTIAFSKIATSNIL